MGKRIWTVSAHKDQDHVEVYDLDWKARVRLFLVETIYDNIDHHLTRHWLCGSGLPDWFWDHSIGKRQWDAEWELLDNSIGANLWELSNKIFAWGWAGQDRCKVASIPITREMLKELWPDCLFHQDDEEESND